jgi:hypothetical protein
MRTMDRRACRGAKVAILLTICLALAACPLAAAASRPPSRVKHPRRMAIYDALRIALAALRRKHMMYQEEYELRAGRDQLKNRWSFNFEFLPHQVGAEVDVSVTDKGATHVKALK